MESYLRKLQIGILTAGCVAGLQEAHAAGITAFYVRKANAYEQTSASAPTPIGFTPAYFVARANGDAASIANTTVSTPSQFFPNVPLDDKGDHVEFSLPADLDQVNTFMPPGNYSFTFGDATVAPLNFAAGTFPTPIPQVSNYAAAQNVDPATAFTVSFNAFTGAGANDAIELEVRNSDDTIAFLKSVTTGTSISIPANTLSSGESYTANIRFIHNVDSNTSSVAGVTGTAGYANDTQFTISTGGDGGGGGGDDTEAPTLAFTTPTNGQTGVAVNTTVNFIFSEAMAKQQLIQWTGADASKFGYSWSSDGQFLTATYSGGFAANTTITYNLQAGPTGFKDLAGNPLVTPAQGSFTTGTGGGSTGGGTGVDPCLTDTNKPTTGSSGSVFKALQFVQTSNSAPVPDTKDPAAAFATYFPTNQTVNTVRITGPNNVDITLDKIPTTSFFSTFQQFPSAAALDAAFPAGNYTITASPAGSGVVNVQAASALPVPTIQNLTQLQALDPTKDFLLNFSPFTGASGQFDNIQITINADGSTRHFYAPDYCLNRTLPNTARSVTIPANTFQAGDKLSGSISFNRFSVNANGIPNTTLSAGVTVTTSFDFTGGSTGSDVRWNAPQYDAATGNITFTAQVPAGKTLVIQKSTDLKTWTQVGTAAPVGGISTYVANAKTGGKYAFFRAIVQ
jgi:hypothetical protein